jgi:anti-sigma factor RsiW
MTEPLDLEPAEEADLVALADGCLPPGRREEIEARVAADPAVAAALECQRRALALLACPPCAPTALGVRLEGATPRAGDASARPREAPGRRLARVLRTRRAGRR